MITLSTTWNSIIDKYSSDSIITEEAINFIYTNPTIKELLNKRILRRGTRALSIGNNTLNKVYGFIFNSNTKNIISDIIIKLYDTKKSYFDANGNQITIEDLIIYISAVFCRILTISKLFTNVLEFNSLNNDYTFKVHFFEHTPGIPDGSDPNDRDDRLDINYSIACTGQDKHLETGGFLSIIVCTYDLFDLDCHIKYPLLDFIKYNLPKVTFRITVYYYDYSDRHYRLLLSNDEADLKTIIPIFKNLVTKSIQKI